MKVSKAGKIWLEYHQTHLEKKYSLAGFIWPKTFARLLATPTSIKKDIEFAFSNRIS